MSEHAEELQRLHEAATPGPWKTWDGAAVVRDTMTDWLIATAKKGAADARLIAAMRNALPSLLDAVEELDRVKAENERLRTIIRVSDETMQKAGDEWEAENLALKADLDEARAKLAEVTVAAAEIESWGARTKNGELRGLTPVVRVVERLAAALASPADTPTNPENDERAQVAAWFERYVISEMRTSVGVVWSLAHYDRRVASAVLPVEAPTPASEQ